MLKRGGRLFQFNFSPYCIFRERKGVLERESENFTKIQRNFKKKIEESGQLFRGAFWQGLIGFSKLGLRICLLRNKVGNYTL